MQLFLMVSKFSSKLYETKNILQRVWIVKN